MLLSRAYKMMISSWHLPIFQLCRSPNANCLAWLNNASIACNLVSLKYNTTFLLLLITTAKHYFQSNKHLPSIATPCLSRRVSTVPRDLPVHRCSVSTWSGWRAYGTTDDVITHSLDYPFPLVWASWATYMVYIESSSPAHNTLDCAITPMH